jgi:hypothetical protein
MTTLVIDHKNGHSTTYQLIQDGQNLPLAYHVETDKRVIDALEYCRKNRLRVKINYGDVATGKSWNEEHDTMGYVSMSKGHEARFPILVHNARAYGGGSLMDNCILKIQESKGKRVLFQAANFQPSTFEIKECSEVQNFNDEQLQGYTHELWINGELYSRHKSLRSAELLKKKLS